MYVCTVPYGHTNTGRVYSVCILIMMHNAAIDGVMVINKQSSHSQAYNTIRHQVTGAAPATIALLYRYQVRCTVR